MSNIENALKIFSSLNNNDKAIISKCLYSHIPTSFQLSADIFFRDARFNGTVCCTKCGSTSIIKNGKRKDGTQKYVCKDCRTNFVVSSGTVLEGTKKPFETWIRFINCMLDDNTLSQCAEKCGIHINTAFLWRHKILAASQEQNKDQVLEGNIQIDETYFRESYKGNHSNNKTFVWTRSAYERGSNSKADKSSIRKRGLSSEQVCVPCAITSSRLTIAKVCKLGSASVKGLMSVFENHIAEGSTIISDCYKSYPAFARNIKASLCQIDDKTPFDKEFNIQRVNYMHSAMKRQFNNLYKGVSTKYLNYYIELTRINLLAKSSRADKLRIMLELLINCTVHTRTDNAKMNRMPMLC